VNGVAQNVEHKPERANATRLESVRETFLFYKNGRWFWINLCAVLLFIALYIAFEPVGGNNGGTAVGYGLGGAATAGILYLMWYGIRKRSYHASATTLQGCLSAHVWLGVALSIIVPLHSAFQFGANIHTLAYVLMMIVVASGVFGAINYTNLAPLIAAHRGGGHTQQLLEQMERLSREIANLTHDRSDAFIVLMKRYDFAPNPLTDWQPGLWRCLRRTAVPTFSASEITNLLANVPIADNDAAVKMVALIARKRELAIRLTEDVRLLTMLKIWLWVHVPVSLALVFAVALHILIVFIYR